MTLRRLLRLVRRRRSAPAPVASREFAALAAWRAFSAEAAERLAAEHRILDAVPVAAAGEGWPGWCGLCDRPSWFALAPDAGPGDLREQLRCAHCGLNARTRAALAALLAGRTPRRERIYLSEQASPAFVWLRTRCPRAEGGEYGLDAARRQRLQRYYADLGGRGPLRERDVTALDFDAGTLDAIGCFDVLEHVPDHAAALREFARVLRPGGRLVLTAPFLDDREASETLARVRPDGGIEHLRDVPEYHADPVGGGVLCFHHFGWDTLDALRAAGFRHAAWQRSWTPREALFGLWTLVAHR